MLLSSLAGCDEAISIASADEEVIRQVNADNVLSSTWGPGSATASSSGAAVPSAGGGSGPAAAGAGAAAGGGCAAGGGAGAAAALSHPKLLAFKYCAATSPLNLPGRASPFGSNRGSPFASPRGSRDVGALMDLMPLKSAAAAAAALSCPTSPLAMRGPHPFSQAASGDVGTPAAAFTAGSRNSSTSSISRAGTAASLPEAASQEAAAAASLTRAHQQQQQQQPSRQVSAERAGSGGSAHLEATRELVGSGTATAIDSDGASGSTQQQQHIGLVTPPPAALVPPAVSSVSSSKTTAAAAAGPCPTDAAATDGRAGGPPHDPHSTTAPSFRKLGAPSSGSSSSCCSSSTSRRTSAPAGLSALMMRFSSSSGSSSGGAPATGSPELSWSGSGEPDALATCGSGGSSGGSGRSALALPLAACSLDVGLPSRQASHGGSADARASPRRQSSSRLGGSCGLTTPSRLSHNSTAGEAMAAAAAAAAATAAAAAAVAAGVGGSSGNGGFALQRTSSSCSSGGGWPSAGRAPLAGLLRSSSGCGAALRSGCQDGGSGAAGGGTACSGGGGGNLLSSASVPLPPPAPRDSCAAPSYSSTSSSSGGATTASWGAVQGAGHPRHQHQEQPGATTPPLPPQLHRRRPGDNAEVGCCPPAEGSLLVGAAGSEVGAAAHASQQQQQLEPCCGVNRYGSCAGASDASASEGPCPSWCSSSCLSPAGHHQQQQQQQAQHGHPARGAPAPGSTCQADTAGDGVGAAAAVAAAGIASDASADGAAAEAAEATAAAVLPPDLPEVDFLERIGRGSFGDVYKGVWCGSIVAVKVIQVKQPLLLPPPHHPQPPERTAKQQQQQPHDGAAAAAAAAAADAHEARVALELGQHEYESWLNANLRHPNIVQLFTSFTIGLAEARRPSACSGAAAAAAAAALLGSGGDSSGGTGGVDVGALLPPEAGCVGGAGGGLSWKTHLVMEWCECGTMQDLLQRGLLRSPGLSPACRLPWVLATAKEFCVAVAYLHSLDVVHGDLKSSNVLLKAAAPTAWDTRGFTAKVSDFGLSRVLDAIHAAHDSEDGSGSDDGPDDATAAAAAAGAAAHAGAAGGTPADTAAHACGGVGGSLGAGLQAHQPRFGALSHAAPELIQGEALSKASDVYSVGVLLWELLSGEVPFLGMHPGQLLHLKLTHHTSELLPFPDHAPPGLAAVCLDCWAASPADRPCMAAVVERVNSLAVDLLGEEQAVAMFPDVAASISLRRRQAGAAAAAAAVHHVAAAPAGGCGV